MFNWLQRLFGSREQRTELGSGSGTMDAETSWPVADGGGMTATLGADATAFGFDTFSDVSMDVWALDLPMIGLMHGTVDATAAAQSTDGGLAYATAQTFAGVSGADIMMMRTVQHDAFGVDEAGTSAYASSTTHFFALDLPIDFGATLELSSYEYVAKHATPRLDLDGSLATFNVDAAAYGGATLVDTQISAFALEDPFGDSFAAAAATTIIAVA